MRRIAAYLTALTLGIPSFAQNGADFINAVQAFSDGNFKKAEILFSVLHAKDSTDSAVTHYLGLCEFSTGKVQIAEAHLRQAVAADSTNSWYLSSLASLYNATQRKAETADACEKLIKLKPRSFKNSYTLCLIGDVKLSRGQDSAAVACYDQALEMDNLYAPAQIGRAEAMRMMGNNPASFFSMNEFINNPEVKGEMKSDFLASFMKTIDAKFWLVWESQITKLMDRCLELHPEDIGSHLNKIQICAIMNDTLGIVEQCRQIIPLAEAKTDTTNLLLAISTLGDYLYLAGNKKEAYRSYERALSINPRYVPVLNNYAYYLSEERRQLRKALKMSKITIEEEPDNATYLDTYAWILHLLGKSAEAKPYFKHSMVYGGKDSAVILQHYSDVLKSLGEKDLSTYYHNLAEQKK